MQNKHVQENKSTLRQNVTQAHPTFPQKGYILHVFTRVALDFFVKKRELASKRGVPRFGHGDKPSFVQNSETKEEEYIHSSLHMLMATRTVAERGFRVSNAEKSVLK